MQKLTYAVVLSAQVSVGFAQTGGASPEELIKKAAKAYKAGDARALHSCFHSANDVERLWAKTHVRSTLLSPKCVKFLKDGEKKFGKAAFLRALGPFADRMGAEPLANVLDHADAIVVTPPDKEDLELGIKDYNVTYKSKDLAGLDEIDIEVDHTIPVLKIKGRWYISLNKSDDEDEVDVEYEQALIRVSNIINDFVEESATTLSETRSVTKLRNQVNPHAKKLKAALKKVFGDDDE